MAILAPPAARIRSVDVLVAPSAPVVPPRGKSRQRRAAQAVLAGFLFLLIGQFGWGAYYEANPKRKDPTFGDKLAKLQAQPTDRPLLLMLGSSRTLLGFHAGLLESEYPNWRAFNFGTPASGPITQLIYLQRLVDAGIIPQMLLIEVLPPALADGPDGPSEQAFLTGERLNYSEVVQVERYGFRGEPLRSAWRDSVSCPVSALRFQLLGRTVPSWIPPRLRSDWSRSTDPHGWTTPPRQSVTDEERAERTANAAAEYRSTLAGMAVDGRPLQALKQVLALGRSRGIPMRLVLMPEAPTFQSLYRPGLGECLSRELETVAREFESPLIQARDWLPEDDFYDGHHLFLQGAEKFTRRLAREALGDGRLP